MSATHHEPPPVREPAAAGAAPQARSSLRVLATSLVRIVLLGTLLGVILFVVYVLAAMVR